MSRACDTEVLVTAEEAFPAFERAVLAARDRIDAGFRVFDPRTPLISDEARATGDTWADLLMRKLDEGVAIRFVISDFDPVVRPDLHRDSWKSAKVFAGIRELTRNPGKLTVRISAHPARVGWGPRLVLWPKVQARLAQTCSDLSGLPDGVRTEALRCMPGLKGYVVGDSGSVRPLRHRFPPMMPVTHHQKVAVIDDAVLYIGGLDLDRRRNDTKRHETGAADTWHDVQLMTRDAELARAARQHLDRFLDECEDPRRVEAASGLLRTLSVRRRGPAKYLSPRITETGLLNHHLDCISRAEKFIYLENQFLRDPQITGALVRRAGEVPGLGLLVLLPAAPMEVAFDNETSLDHRYGEYLQSRCINRLGKAFGDRLMIVSPAQKRRAEASDRSTLAGAPIIFVHSKVSVFDDRAAIVSSANLNGRSMRWDTELGMALETPGTVRALRHKVMRAWLPETAGDEYLAAEPGTVEVWRQLAERNRASDPENREGFILPFDAEPAHDFGTPLPGVPVEMV
ncbi:phospholipase D family protein [Roseobacter sp.]|uniref:phospholipase D family protein n=1 Tax=Roseobacter sp. TaxID=1907202 RepID=UPI0025E8B55A|nr:phospholipase D family protein [Roseobacter sp.]